MVIQYQPYPSYTTRPISRGIMGVSFQIYQPVGAGNALTTKPRETPKTSSPPAPIDSPSGCDSKKNMGAHGRRPSSTDGHLTISWKNPRPANPGGRATSADDPYTDYSAILAKCPKWTTVAATPGPFRYFLSFFLCLSCGLATNNETGRAMNGREIRNHRRKS